MSEQLDPGIEDPPSDKDVLSELLEEREWSAEFASLVIAGLDPVKDASYGPDGWERFLCFLPGGLQERWRNHDGTFEKYDLAHHAIDEHISVQQFIRGDPRSPAEWLQVASDWNYEPHWKSLVADHSVFTGAPVKVSGAAQIAKNPARQAGGLQRYANSRAGKAQVAIKGKFQVEKQAAKEMGLPVDRDKFLEKMLDEHLLPGANEKSKRALRQRREPRATAKSIKRWVGVLS